MTFVQRRRLQKVGLVVVPFVSAVLPSLVVFWLAKFDPIFEGFGFYFSTFNDGNVALWL